MTDKSYPADVDAENSVLGGVLLGADFPELDPDDFHDGRNRNIWKTMQRCYQKHQAVELSLLTPFFDKRTEINNLNHVSVLLERTPGLQNFDRFVRIVREYSARRKLMRSFDYCVEHMYDPSANLDHLLERLQVDLNHINNNGFREFAMVETVMEMAEFANMQLPTRQYYLEPWLHQESITLISGGRGTGKSFFAISILDAIAKGKSFGPWDAGVSVPTLYLDGEMSVSELHRRLNKYPPMGRDQPLYVLSSGIATRKGVTGNLLDENWRAQLKDTLVKLEVKLWVCDNLASLSPGIDEKDKQHYDPINQFFIQLRHLGISTIALHHTNKKDEQRGTSAREDNIDVSILLKGTAKFQDETRFVANFTKNRSGGSGMLYEFILEDDEYGLISWNYQSGKDGRKREAIKLLAEAEYTQEEIAELVGYAGRSSVSEARRWARNKGYLTSDNQLTQSGEEYVNGRRWE